MGPSDLGSVRAREPPRPAASRWAAPEPGAAPPQQATRPAAKQKGRSHRRTDDGATLPAAPEVVPESATLERHAGQSSRFHFA